MQIGNWLITEEGIEYSSDRKADYFIDRSWLNATRAGVGDATIYDCLVHLSGRTFTTREDIDQLNKAFTYALNYFDIDLIPDVLISTKEEQKCDMIGKEDGEENHEGNLDWSFDDLF